MGDFDGLGVHLGNLSRLSRAESRSISAENFSGAKGQGGMATEGTGATSARELGQGWKVSPSINIGGNETATLAEIEGPGAIQHIWMTVHPTAWRKLVFRCYWDGEESPSIETPVGDFFCNGWGVRTNINSLPVSVNPAGGFNSYWEMPFRKSARITVENLGPEPVNGFYYQVDYVLTDVPDDRAYLHAQWRRSNPLPYQTVHTLLDGVEGQGQFVGTYIAWGVNNNGWWGEGEIKFYHGWRRRLADDLRHRHRGLLRRRLELGRQHGDVRHLFDAVPGDAAGDQAGWPVRGQHPLRDVPLARPGPDPVHARICG